VGLAALIGWLIAAVRHRHPGPDRRGAGVQAARRKQNDLVFHGEQRIRQRRRRAPAGGFAVNVFLRDGDTVYRTWHTDGRGTEQLSHSFALIDLLPYGRQEEWQDSPEDWPQSPTYSRWAGSEDIAALYGPDV
jgi:predicted dithiol-disulfide oxidoreductase (DUF899 family)